MTHWRGTYAIGGVKADPLYLIFSGDRLAWLRVLHMQNIFDAAPTRTYKGPWIDAAAAPTPFPRPADEEMCERWAVLTSIFEPTETVKQLAELSGWCVVFVGDENGGCCWESRVGSLGCQNDFRRLH